MRSESTTTGADVQISLLTALASILELAASEPGSIDEANETLYAIEDRANVARNAACRHFIVTVEENGKCVCQECGETVPW